VNTPIKANYLLVRFVLCVFLLPVWQSSAAAEQWKIATSWPGGPFIDSCVKPFAEQVTLLTEGRLELRVFQGGVLGDPLQVSDTVLNGAAEMGMQWPGYDWGKDKASMLFGGYAGGVDSEQMLHWLYEGGGAELWRKWRDEKFGLVGVPVCAYSTEVFMHSRKPVRSLADLQGLKVRTAGVWLELARKLGAAPVTSSGGDVFPMLERGVIDGAEWGTPWHNVIAGFHKAAKYVIIPGVHQPSAVFELLINKKSWAALSPRDQELVLLAAKLNTFDFWLKNGEEDAKALAAFADNKNEIIELAPEVRAKAKELGLEWAEAQAQNNPWAKQVFESQRTFEQTWNAWGKYRHFDVR